MARLERSRKIGLYLAFVDRRFRYILLNFSVHLLVYAIAALTEGIANLRLGKN